MQDYDMGILVAVDNGFDATKVYTIINGKEYKFAFKSKYEESDDDLNKQNTMNFYYDGKDYLIGEGASMDNFEYDKTNNELHKICTYAALARLSNYVGMKFNLIAGYPLNLYSANKIDFAKYLTTDEFVETKIRYDGNVYEEKLFQVNDCIVLPQGVGALYIEPDRWKDKVVGVIDIGGLTINGCVVDNLNIVRETMFTEKCGIKILMNDIKKKLDSIYGVDIKEYEMKKIIFNKKYKKFGQNIEESTEIIEKIMENYIKNIQNIMRKNKFDIESLEDILFIGGGSIIVRDELCKIYPQAVFIDDPVYANVRGFYEVGRILYGTEDD